MHSVKIFLLAIVAAVFYGQVHDQITAHLCVEYFTIGHPKMIESEEPWRLAIYWGFAATWWVGAILGLGLAVAARFGDERPKFIASDLIGPIAGLLGAMVVCAVSAGVAAAVFAHLGWARLPEPLASSIPPGKRFWFLIDWWTHGASYLSGFVGGITLWVLTWRRRRFATHW